MKALKIVVPCVVILFNFFMAKNSLADDAMHIADYKYWSVYKTSDGTKYMVGYPIADEGNFAKRERPYFMVTNFAGTVETSVYVGYYYKKDSEPKIVVNLSAKDPKKVETYPFYTKNDMGWNKDRAKDSALIASLKIGDKMIVSSESTKNTVAKDTYSLEGFSAAYAEIIKK